MTDTKMTRRGFTALIGTLAVSGCVVTPIDGGGGGGGEQQIFLQPGFFRYNDITANISVNGSIMTTQRFTPLPQPPRTYRQTGVNTFVREGGSTVATILNQDTVQFDTFVWRRISS